MDEAARARIRELHAKAEVLSDGRTTAGADDLLAEASALARSRARADGGGDRSAPPEHSGEGEGPPSDAVGGDPAIVKASAALDQSDTDNAKRLVSHFGRDLAVAARDGKAGGDWLIWEGRHWDLAGGARGAVMRAKQVGGRIGLEAEFLAHTPAEARAVKAAAAWPPDDASGEATHARAGSRRAREALDLRRKARWRFAVSSKNAGRVKAMLDMAAPDLCKPAGAFNRDPLKFACENATLSFVVQQDLDCPDPDVERNVARVEVNMGHDRADCLTGIVAAPYDPDASAPKWKAFLDRCVPDPDVRRTLKAYSGTGLLGVLPQKLAFHYGRGANGKSVFLAVLGNVVGASLGVALPKETIMGTGERGAGQASPDVIRLFGKRLVRIDEIKENESLREDLIKRLTGGDTVVARDLFSGYLEFRNVATPHMVGNGYPKIEGTDEGIWRRMLVFLWGVTIPEADRKPFDAFVVELCAERAGILNWLIEGACDFLANGLTVAEASRAATAEYREEMDPIGRFVADCVEPELGGRVQARALYEAYRSWGMANAVSVCFETKFGREMKKRFPKDGGRSCKAYLGIALHDVPTRPEEFER